LQEFSPGWGGDYDYIVFGRLKAGVSTGRAASELRALEARIVEEHKLYAGLHAQVRPLQEVISSPVRAGLEVLLAAVMLLVLIVCVNLANLLLARGGARAREYALRIAIGAARSRLLSSALTETLLLAATGGVLGVIAARTALAAFVRTGPVDLPRMDEMQIDARVMAFALGLSVLCGLLFGLLPALRLSRSDPQGVLRGESHTMTGGRSRLRLREWLVGGEVALSTVLLVLAGLLVSSLWHVLRVDRGFTTDRTVEVRLDLPSRYKTVQARVRFFDLAMERLRALPGVRSVSVTNKVPLTGESNVNSVDVKGKGALDPVTRKLVMVNVRFIAEDYFAALGIPLVRGRTIEPADRERKVVVVSQRLAEKLWPGENPVGKVLTTGSNVKESEVVGVVGDVHSTRLERDPTLMIYAPFWPNAFQVSNLVARAAGDPRVVMGEIRRAVQAIDSGIPAPKMRTMGEIVEESVAQRRFQMRVAVGFAGAALLLAALGIYGVVAYGIALRRRELGIRMALGARVAQVRRMVLLQGLRPVFAGLAAGMFAAIAAGSLVRTLLFGIAAYDGLTLTAVAAVLATVAALACLLPAQSAASIDPARVLRNE
jgi:putative ABC transport system permease protein